MLNHLKDYIKSKPKLYDLLNACRPIKDPAENWINQYSKKNPNIHFIQISANDGLRWDPIRRFVIRDHWTGVFVEPLPTAYTMLRSNYAYLGDERFEFANAAISTDNETHLKFWSFNEDFLSKLSLERRMYYLRKASFNQDNVKYSIGKDDEAEQQITAIEVPCHTLHDLVEKYSPNKTVDFLMIDAEGYDAKIIKSIDFKQFSPRAIFFESHSLGDEKEEIYQLLQDSGYQVESVSGDSAATKVMD